MKTNKVWIEISYFSKNNKPKYNPGFCKIITIFNRKKTKWVYKPCLHKTSMIYNRHKITRQCPLYEFCWGPFVMHLILYNLEQNYDFYIPDVGDYRF
jgi:hypothetical protein